MPGKQRDKSPPRSQTKPHLITLPRHLGNPAQHFPSGDITVRHRNVITLKKNPSETTGHHPVHHQLTGAGLAVSHHFAESRRVIAMRRYGQNVPVLYKRVHAESSGLEAEQLTSGQYGAEKLNKGWTREGQLRAGQAIRRRFIGRG
jgi:hypothetical protein